MGAAYSRERIFGELREIFTEHFELEPENVLPDTSLEALDLDSIDAVDLMVEIKRRTGKKLQPEAFKQVRTVQDIIDALFDQLNK
jgi:acyl carrier protein